MFHSLLPAESLNLCLTDALLGWVDSPRGSKRPSIAIPSVIENYNVSVVTEGQDDSSVGSSWGYNWRGNESNSRGAIKSIGAVGATEKAKRLKQNRAEELGFVKIRNDDLELKELLGAGGSGQVWKGDYCGTDVAVKQVASFTPMHIRERTRLLVTSSLLRFFLQKSLVPRTGMPSTNFLGK